MSQTRTANLTLQEAVAQLADYAADEIAELMRRAGKTGHVGEEDSCPVANYLHDVLGEVCRVDTDRAWLTDDYGDDVVKLPGGVQAFVDAFDHYAYPDLITETEETL
jgi:hypothetical protein